jgi:2-haloacid dehalogenase
MLRSATQHHGLLFDNQVSVESAGVFKPHHKTYETAAGILETNIASVCHVAAHPFDCIGAKATGMRSIYVNRRDVPFGFSPYKPDLEVTDFHELATALA